MSIFKKKSGQISATSIPMTEAEAALAQSDFNIEKITEIQNKFTGGAILLVPGRIFIREGLLWKVCRKGIKKRQFFLFNDILVYGSVVASRYSNQHSLSLDKMSVSSECFYQPRVQSDFDADAESLDQQLEPANAFQISHADKSFHVFSASAADKANWLANLNKHISRAAQLVADSPQQMMTRPVWVPDAVAKECMICHTKFSTFVRKHHCRRCGRVVCSSCSPHHVSLSSHDLASSGHAPCSGEHKKLERVCKECFKEMTAQHNRSNSQSRSSREPKPSPTLSHDELGLSVSLPGTMLKTEDHESSDTEDSDDSSDEKSVLENQSNIRTSSVTKQPDSKSDHKVERLGEKEEKRESLVELKGSDESAPSTRTGSSEQLKDDSSDVQPTPPPRKKKLEKLLKKQIQANERTDLATNQGVEQGEELPDAGDEGDKELSSSRKTKRKMKHSKPPADSTCTVDTVTEPAATVESSASYVQPDDNNVTPEVTEENAEQSASDKVEDIDGGEEEEGKQVKKEEGLVSPEDTPTKVAEGTGEEREDTPTMVAEGAGEEREDTTMAAEGTGEEREVDQEHSPSQKKSRGRRKKFKPAASERTDMQAS